MGRIDGRPADCQYNRAAKNGSSAARDPLRKICARIHPRNEKRPTGVQEAAARSSKSSYRNCWPEASRSYELEKKKQKQLAHAAAPGSALLRRRCRAENYFLPPHPFHRINGGRDAAEPIARLRNTEARDHYVAHFLYPLLGGRLLFCRDDYVFARISKHRCAKCERHRYTRAPDRPTA